MDCFDANLVQELMSGGLARERRTEAIAHLDVCEDCRHLVNVNAAAVALEATALPVEQTALGDTREGSDPGIAIPVAAAPGKRLGRFTLVERLGAGAMGVVWRAEDPNLGRHVALKLLRRADPSLTERLVREARSMAQVNHPNVVTVYDVGQAEDGTTFIAMELVTGRSLRSWQSARKRSIPEIVAAYVAAARGLAAAHAAGIVHRDFKPDNVLVGDDERVRVTDFGLAAAKAGDSEGAVPLAPISDVNLTTSGSVLGTPAYMAPEQFTGGNVDPRTDQFNFCVALYEALYGRRPFAGSAFAELADNVIYGRVETPPAGSHVSTALRAILLRGLSRKPGDRFATMHQLILELGRDRARTWRRTVFAATSVAAALAIGLVADSSVRDRLASEARQSFALTGKQVERAAAQLTEQFDTYSDIVYHIESVRELAGYHDQADFGLGTPEQDRDELEHLHALLASASWYTVGKSELAIGDYKGRMIYASLAPAELGTDLKVLPSIKHVLDVGRASSVIVTPYSDPALASTHILGSTPHAGLAVIFVRSLSFGDSDASEARALYLQLQDGTRLLDNIRLDDDTLLALAAPTGDAVRDPSMPPALVTAALASTAVREVHVDGSTYQVQARAITGFEGQGTVAHVIMARRLDGVLQLFPGARIVFALTAISALGLAALAWFRARAITEGRV